MLEPKVPIRMGGDYCRDRFLTRSLGEGSNFPPCTRSLPFTFGICASSCVPASPFESPGAHLGREEVRELLDEHGAIGVAEMMDFPGSSA